MAPQLVGRTGREGWREGGRDERKEGGKEGGKVREGEREERDVHVHVSTCTLYHVQYIVYM